MTLANDYDLNTDIFNTTKTEKYLMSLMKERISNQVIQQGYI